MELWETGSVNDDDKCLLTIISRQLPGHQGSLMLLLMTLCRAIVGSATDEERHCLVSYYCVCLGVVSLKAQLIACFGNF